MPIRTALLVSMFFATWTYSLLTTTVAHALDASVAMTSTTVQVEGAPVHYLKAGRGPAVLLLHGLSGHWVMEEQTHQTTDALLSFLADSQT